MTVLAVKDLKVSFPGEEGTVAAVNGVSFSIHIGEKLGIVGESGSGKSVVGASIIRMLPVTAKMSGSIRFMETDLCLLSDTEIHRIRGTDFAFIPQNPAVTLNPILSCGWQIAEMFVERRETKPESWKKMLSILSRLLFPKPEKNALQYPHQFSGGMKQRVVTGISMTTRPKLLIADEPTKGLDKDSCSNCRDIFTKITEDHDTSFLLITHDLDLAEGFCNRIAVMYAGELVEIGDANDIFSDPRHPYTKGLLNARPRCGLKPLSGHSPDLMHLPVGCYFQDRCSLCDEACITEHPHLFEDQGRWIRCHHRS